MRIIAIPALIISLPPLLSLDPDQKEQLIEVIEKLLKDRSTVSTARALCVGRALRR